MCVWPFSFPERLSFAATVVIKKGAAPRTTPPRLLVAPYFLDLSLLLLSLLEPDVPLLPESELLP